MEDESTYFRYYLTLTIERRGLILVAAIVAAAVALLLTLTLDQIYVAEATLAILRSRTEVEFDERIRTLSDYELARADTGSRQDALIALVRSNEVVQRVLDDVSPLLDEEDQDLQSLREMVETQSTGDLININVSYEDPKTAAHIANSWVEHYERYVNAIYSSSPIVEGSTTADQVQSALQRYNSAQQAVEAFTAEDSVPALEREVETQERILADYYRTLARVQGGPIDNRQVVLADYYTEMQQIENWLADARALREQVQMGTDSRAAEAGNALALISLRSRIFNTVPGARVTTTTSQEATVNESQASPAGAEMIVQLDLGAISDESITVGDVDSVIEVLEQRRLAAQDRIANLIASFDSGAETEAQATDSGTAQLLADIRLLEGQVASLTAEIESQTARRRELERARDTAWDTYQVLLGRQIEEAIMRESPAAEVRIADTAVEPTRPLSRGLLRNTALAAMAAAILATGVIIATDWWKGGAQYISEPPEQGTPAPDEEDDGFASSVPIMPAARSNRQLRDSAT